MDREKELEEQILKHDKLYWEDGNPEISDPEYDKLVEELRNINPNNPILNKINTPKLNSKEKIKHKNSMLSLNKVYTIQDLLNWAGKVKSHNREVFILQTKYDGWSIELNNGKLSTRGDGYEGDDISEKIVYIRDVNGNPLNSNSYIHGEVVMLKSIFKKFKSIIKRNNGEEYKTERTILQGLLGSDEVNNDAEGILTLVPFDYNNFYFMFSEIPLINWDEIINNVKNSDFPADGLVLKIGDQEYAKSLGSTKHHLKSAMALKFENPEGNTILRDVFFSMGKGVITPVGIVDPVEISGVTIDSPNLHNYKYILDNDIHIGDTLIIERAGDVIPDVKEVIPGENRKKIELKNCPICNAIVVYDEPFLKCTNQNCPGKNTKQLLDAVKRVGIEELGEPTLLGLMQIGCNKLADIFRVTKDDILKLERYGEKKSSNLYNEIQRVKNEGIYEWQLLASLNIPGIGLTLSKDILSLMSLKELMTKKQEDLISIDKIGPERSLEIANGLQKYEDNIKELLSIINIKREEIEDNKNGMTICFTGTFPEKKKFYEDIARKAGLKVLDKVSKDLIILVCADSSKNSGKYKLANKYCIPIWGIDEFLNTYNKS